VLDKNVLKSVSDFLKLIDSLVEGKDLVNERMRWDRGGRCEARLDMFSKAEIDKLFLIRGYVLNELPNTRIDFKEQNVFEGRGGDDRNSLGLPNLMFKRNAKVLENEGQ